MRFSTISALTYSLSKEVNHHLSTSELNRTVNFVDERISKVPDYLKWPLHILIIVFAAHTVFFRFRFFYHLSHDERASVISGWKSGLGFQKDFIRLIESLAITFVFSFPHEKSDSLPKPKNLSSLDVDEFRTDCCVVGAGPGGAVTALTLSEAGREVLILEEGAYYEIDSAPHFSVNEMRQKYRHGGISAAFGKNKIVYVEGSCVGGGSEINSGLYHRITDGMLSSWEAEYGLVGASPKDMEPFFSYVEQVLSIQKMPHLPPKNSRILADGAQALGYSAQEIPRWYKYESGSGNFSGIKQSMTQTLIPKAIGLGARLETRMKVLKIEKEKDGYLVTALSLKDAKSRKIEIYCNSLFLCAGAIHTPGLLLKSGIRHNVGDQLQLHPTAKITASFKDEINQGDDVPVHQIKSLSPRLSFGGSVSSRAYLALALQGFEDIAEVEKKWTGMSNYYTMIKPEGKGKIRTLPGCQDPVVSYKLTNKDYSNLSDGLNILSKILFAAGAEKLYPSLSNRTVLTKSKWQQLDFRKEDLNLMTIHLFSSCPMGEEKSIACVDSYGKLHGYENLYINDASLLCTALGVNPQGTIMAFARRNALHFLDSIKRQA